MGRDMLTILVTGGAGFIGSALVRYLINTSEFKVVNLDKLTYAGNLESLETVAGNSNYFFEQVDICDAVEVQRVFDEHRPNLVMHLAAESHVDRSIDGPEDFIKTNVMGTCALLEAARKYWQGLADGEKAQFRFHHVSTDEVYGDLPHPDDAGVSVADLPLFNETTAYAPSSPYSASKAAADHLVRAWQRTYGLPVVLSNCSNNYGPYHYPEKLIPLTILNALDEKQLPVYGSGSQIRDWLYVEDHVRALVLVATAGALGETYNIGGHNEKRNIEVVQEICAILDDLAPRANRQLSYVELVTHVSDRPGHDRRYAIDASKIERELDWRPQETFQSGLRKTVQWYLNNQHWCKRVQKANYQRERLGVL